MKPDGSVGRGKYLLMTISANCTAAFTLTSSVETYAVWVWGDGTSTKVNKSKTLGATHTYTGTAPYQIRVYIASGLRSITTLKTANATVTYNNINMLTRLAGLENTLNPSTLVLAAKDLPRSLKDMNCPYHTLTGKASELPGELTRVRFNSTAITFDTLPFPNIGYAVAINTTGWTEDQLLTIISWIYNIGIMSNPASTPEITFTNSAFTSTASAPGTNPTSEDGEGESSNWHWIADTNEDHLAYIASVELACTGYWIPLTWGGMVEYINTNPNADYFNIMWSTFELPEFENRATLTNSWTVTVSTP